MATEDQQENSNKLNEPGAEYRNARLRVFHSYEETANAEATIAANQSGMERIRETVE